MKYNKKTTEGYEQRIAVMERFLPGAKRIVETALGQYPRKQLARDDIVDALVGAVTTSMSGSFQTIPDGPEVDDAGLSMEIVYKSS
jgi:predicted RNase H-like nuclease